MFAARVLAISFLAWAVVSAPSARAAVGVDATDRLRELVRKELSKKYPEARIELTSGVQWAQGSLPARVDSVTVLSMNARGEAQFVARGGSAEAEGWVRYGAWVPSWVALRRILPGEKLSPDLFATQDVDVSQGPAFEYRGVILARGADLSKLEARQTILEGQYPLESGVQRIPDIRRGEAVRVNLVSGDIMLSTSGIAEEPAYIGAPVRILAGKAKRELQGKLKAVGEVEVQL